MTSGARTSGTTSIEKIKRVFPDREPVELPLEHPIFHCVYRPQGEAAGAQHPIRDGIPATRAISRGSAMTPREVHYRAIFDDKGRMMAIICHNTDLGDGWEREGRE